MEDRNCFFLLALQYSKTILIQTVIWLPGQIPMPMVVILICTNVYSNAVKPIAPYTMLLIRMALRCVVQMRMVTVIVYSTNGQTIVLH